MTDHKKNYQFRELVGVITELRAENGCPWDRKQTPESLTRYLLEEAQELAEAIGQGETKHIKEEIGDLFFILILLTLIHQERKEFTLNEGLEVITRKMIRRHPHVFAGLATGSESELRRQWEEIKAKEK